jgi:hypothetical protein
MVLEAQPESIPASATTQIERQTNMSPKCANHGLK